MIELDHIEESYPFQHLRWVDEGRIIDTNKGKKCLKFWPDEHMLQAQITWREELTKQTGVLTDRMIQTSNGEKAISTGAGWITLHDMVEDLYPVWNHPNKIGAFLGHYITMPYRYTMSSGSLPLNDENISLDRERLVQSLPVRSVSYKLVDKLKKEALTRLERVASFLKRHELTDTPNEVVSIYTLAQAKLVHGELFWENNEKKSTSPYKVLRRCLGEWENRGDSLYLLLNGLNRTFPLNKDRGTLLLAHIVYPYEMIKFINRLMQETDITPGQEKAQLNDLVTEWDTNKRVCETMVDWLQDVREKVVQ
ncbi:hypothetical protein [Salipaludibacillus agaradhaerens]|jgi:hypothetical protein|uniref:hypothetical protein n=1 Tax=Salipaludibacillus agaradhaerens TaxID=76935 RepID=UPI000997E382|nr:hypothetical protein [Salipaludibacillus agaradhaerens]